MKNYKDLLKDAESLISDVSDSTFKDNTGAGKIIAAAAVGLAVGAVLGVLFAPAAGTETRSTLSDSVNNLSGTVRDKAKQGVDKINDLKNQAVDSVKSRVNSDSESIPAV